MMSGAVTRQRRLRQELDPATSDASTSQNGTSKPRSYQRHAKPPFSYVGLVAVVISVSPDKQLPLVRIYEALGHMFPFFVHKPGSRAYSGWKQSVRHNLTQHTCFTKNPVDPGRPNCRNHNWTVNLNKVPENAFKLQNTAVAREGGYADDIWSHLSIQCPLRTDTEDGTQHSPC